MRTNAFNTNMTTSAPNTSNSTNTSLSAVSDSANERDVLLTRDAHVATLTFSNERRFNAMSLSMWLKLGDLLESLNQDPEVRALVLRGQGDRAFVSGADISEFGEQRNDPASVANYDRAVSRAQGALAQFASPVIAAISGICYGGGLGLVLACDLRYASESAKFRMPAARLGLGYAYAGVKRMMAILGPAKASEVFYTAKVFEAKEAHALGLLNGVETDVFAKAHETAMLIAENAPLTIKAAKMAFNAALNGSAHGDVAAVDEAVKACFKSKDYAEGRAAFAEKRAPLFKGE
jgi:enoyl-CoA hydratase/carnithine racemase